VADTSPPRPIDQKGNLARVLIDHLNHHLRFVSRSSTSHPRPHVCLAQTSNRGLETREEKKKTLSRASASIHLLSGLTPPNPGRRLMFDIRNIYTLLV
jgi:hypothetical protein